MKSVGTIVAITSIALHLCAPTSAQVTQWISVGMGGVEGNYDSLSPSISSDGRFVAFESASSNLVSGDTNHHADIFVRDRWTGITEIVSLTAGGAQINGNSSNTSISADGRFVAFYVQAAASQVHVRDRQVGTTEIVSVSSLGVFGNGGSWAPSISADGRYVVFHSLADNLVPGDSNLHYDVFIRDRQSGTTERVSVASGGAEGDLDSMYPSVSADGRYVVFESNSHNLVPGDTNGYYDIFLRDRLNGTTQCVSVNSSGIPGDNWSSHASISADGRFAAFDSSSTNLVPADTNNGRDLFVRDLQSGVTERANLGVGGVQANSGSEWSSISPDGRFVAFLSDSTNLVPGDTNGHRDAFVRDRQDGTTWRVSIASSGAQTNDACWGPPSISADGTCVAFRSGATNLGFGPPPLIHDVFLHDSDALSFTSLCSAGVGGVVACPCSNPPSGSGRGCDNSSGTGGAILSASGIAYLSMDSLVFTTEDQRPLSTSILLQGTTSPSAGLVYGQGVRCVGGALRRLFTKQAVTGRITAPDFPAGDPTISARSAAKGDTIQAGQSRWYLVFYRDPTVLGSCPAASTFNATQTGRVDWSL